MRINIPILYTRNGIEIFSDLAKNKNNRILIDDNEILIFALQEFEKALVEENNESRLKLLEKEFNYVLNYGKEENIGFDLDFKETRTVEDVDNITFLECSFKKGKKSKINEQEGFGGIFSIEKENEAPTPLKTVFSQKIQVDNQTMFDLDEFNIIEDRCIIEPIVEIIEEPEPEYVLSEKDLEKIKEIENDGRFKLLELKNERVQKTIHLIAIFLHEDYNQELYLLSFYNNYLLTNEYTYLCYKEV